MKKLISDKRLSYGMTIMVSCDPVVRLAHQVVAEFFGSRVAKVFLMPHIEKIFIMIHDQLTTFNPK